MIESQFTVNTFALPPVFGVALLLLGSYVALDLVHRAQRLGGAEGRLWLLAGAFALGAGLWVATVLGVADALSHGEAGFDAWMSAAAMAVAGVLCLLGLSTLQAPEPTRPRTMLGSGLLGGAVLAAQLTVTMSLGLQPGVHWHPLWLALAWLIASGGFALGLPLLAGQRSQGARVRRQMLVASIITVAALAAQALCLHAAALHGQMPLPIGALVPAATMVALASTGGAELLLLMLLASAVEARMRGNLEQARSALQDHALRDELTGLPNRIGFEAMLARSQRQADTANGQSALLLVALDDFKQVNETLGHQSGDELLRRVAERLSQLVPLGHAARLGGDEFLLLMDGEPSAQHAGALAARVLEALAAPCRLVDRELDVSASIGVALYPQHGAMSALIAHASVAMRASKSAGGATYSIFDPRMVIDARDQAELLRDLRLAMSRSQLELYFQPKIHAPSAQITGVEALLRWHHPTRGMISPNVFVPLAERSGIINALGAWVIDDACRHARVWRDQGLRMRVAVNLSAHQLRQADLPQYIAAALQRHQINPDLLTCEITESVAMEDTDATMRFFTELAAVGVHISIDDFGSGYSSLGYLRKLPAGELKIDRSFVLDLAHSEEARTIAGAVVQMAQALNLKVVAEGVETEEQFQILRALGCDELQGFLFARPMSAKALGLWAMDDEGPRNVQFSEALFQETQAMAI